jgi:type IV pilus assembly protein PilY1
MYYWVHDLRTTGTKAPNNVKPSTADPAYWQHMNTFTIGLGVNGTLAYPGDWDALQPDGNKNWPATPSGGDTVTTSPGVLPKFDDLWHAAVNGRGGYYRATDPTSLAAGLTGALKAISGASSYGVAAAASTSDFRSPDETDFTTYASSYKVINWSGDISKYVIDPTSGLKTGSPLWSASKQLDIKANPGLSSPVNATAYTTRNIITRTEAGSAVEFTYATLSATQKTALCYKASPGTGPCILTSPDNASLVNYLRGEAAYEGDYGTAGTRFRNRHDTTESFYYKRDLMGTIVNAKPAYVAMERRIYQEGTDPGFTAFRTASLSRAPVLYAPANDGMVHALDAATGNELWAYIPGLVIPTGTDEDGFEKGLRALSYQDGGAPAYNHHFYLDATPGVEAVDFSRSTGVPITASSPSGDWRSILVGGLGKGGKGYYALDVTSPASTVATAKSAVLWEFPSAADSSHSPVVSGGLMGHSFGMPIIAKTAAWGWVAIVPSGYNNSDGFGYIFVLNAKTGALLHTAKTPGAAPGLAHITTLAKTNNRVVTQVYGGDLNGTLWRFDLTGTAPPSVGVQIFSSSSDTPITSEPNVSVDTNTGDRWVFFGTGKYLDVADRTTAIPSQYLVALHDGTVDTPGTGGVVPLSALTPVTDLMAGVTSGSNGWKYELSSHPGERVVIKPVADLRTVVFASAIPTTNPCAPGLVGYAYGLEYSTGKSRLMVGGAVVPYYYSDTGIAGITLMTSGKDPTTGSRGDAKIRIDTRGGGSVGVALDTRKINSGTRHVGWRELLNEY